MDRINYDLPCKFIGSDVAPMFIAVGNTHVNVVSKRDILNKRGSMGYAPIYTIAKTYTYSSVTDDNYNYFIPGGKQWNDYGSLCKIIVNRHIKKTKI